MDKQHTIAEETSFSGVGLHTGSLTSMTFKPAPPNSGVTFHRIDLSGKPAIQADIEHVVDVSRGTTIGLNGAKVHTVEHVLAAIYGSDVDNIAIELDGPEIPNCDGSAQPFLMAVKEAGVVEQDATREYITITDPVFYRQDDVALSILPADELRITMTIAYDHVAVGTQYASFVITPASFEKEMAAARTFCFLREVKMLQEKGLIKGGSLDSAIVIGDEYILNDDLRFPDEFVRHKMLDLLGDMFLLGRRVRGHVIGVKTGHSRNVMFSKQIRKAYLNGHVKKLPPGLRGRTKPAPAIDVTMIMKVFPSRFPFLLVDRILEFQPQERVVGIKNVTVDEPFFHGHWPHVPAMPGVLIVEVMAQVGSVLVIGGDGEPPAPQVYLAGVERARFRRNVVPGDQIVVEGNLIDLQPDSCRVKAVARVDGAVTAEAELLYGFVTDSR